MKLQSVYLSNYSKKDTTTFWNFVKNKEISIISYGKGQFTYENFTYNEPLVILSFRDKNGIDDIAQFLENYQKLTIKTRNNSSKIKEYTGEIRNMVNLFTVLDIFIGMDLPVAIGGDNKKFYGKLESSWVNKIYPESDQSSFLFQKFYPIKKITFQVKNFSKEEFFSSKFEPFISCKINNWEQPLYFWEPITIDCGERMKIYKITDLQNFDSDHLDYINIIYETED